MSNKHLYVSVISYGRNEAERRVSRPSGSVWITKAQSFQITLASWNTLNRACESTSLRRAGKVICNHDKGDGRDNTNHVGVDGLVRIWWGGAERIDRRGRKDLASGTKHVSQNTAQPQYPLLSLSLLNPLNNLRLIGIEGD
jgi:hypothetical protein